MLKCLLLLPIILLFVGIMFVVAYLFKLLFNSTTSIIDCSYECLTASSEVIKEVSTKYAYRIRGSVRLSQGRIKSIEDVKAIKNSIVFP